MVGWIAFDKAELRVNFPVLSEEEKEIVDKVEKRLSEIIRIKEIDENNIRDEIENIVKEIEEEENLEFEKQQREDIIDYAVKHIYGLGALEELIKREDIEEIALIGLEKPIYVYIRKEGWKRTNVGVEGIEFLMDLINKMIRDSGKRITLKKPRVDAMLKDNSRLHASIPPISKGEITIRKFTSKPFSPPELVNLKTMPTKVMILLSLLMQSDSSILVAGNTASGKTTLLNSLFSFVPWKERIIITEETPEINVLQKHSIRLVSNEMMGVELKDLVYDSLRMRPDRIIVGEIRNEKEAEALLDVLLAGQARGAYGTIHGKSGNETIKRLRSFGIGEEEIKSIDLVITLRRIGVYKGKHIEERRRLFDLTLVGEKEEVVCKYDIEKDNWKLNEKKLIEKIKENTGMKEKEIKEIVKRRERLFKEKDFVGFFNNFQKKEFGME